MQVKQKNKFGQYFTPTLIAEFMVRLASANPATATVLEPSAGKGVFLDVLSRYYFEDVSGVELDESLIALRHADRVTADSFVSYAFTRRYHLIIGNPPYIRWKNLEDELKSELADNLLWNTYCNRLCDYASIFLLRAVSLLHEGGELIFITPEYWFNTTHAQGVRDFLLANGTLTHVYHFGEATFFGGATVSTVVFRYVRGRAAGPVAVARASSQRRAWSADELAQLHQCRPLSGVEYFTLPAFVPGTSWALSPPHQVERTRRYELQCAVLTGAGQQQDLFAPPRLAPFATIGQVCHVANGLVSGLDAAFQLPASLVLNAEEIRFTVRVAKAKHLRPFAPTATVRYALLPPGTVSEEAELALRFPGFYAQLAPYRADLAKRYQYATPAAYWEWSFLRNYALLASPVPRLLVPCKERITNKNHFRFAYAEPGIYATQDVTALTLKPGVRESLFYVLALLNNPRVFTWLSTHGILKGGIVEFSEKPINSIPVRRIDWENLREVRLHDQIVAQCQAMVRHYDEAGAAELDRLVGELLG